MGIISKINDGINLRNMDLLGWVYGFVGNLYHVNRIEKRITKKLKYIYICTIIVYFLFLKISTEIKFPNLLFLFIKK